MAWAGLFAVVWALLEIAVGNFLHRPYAIMQVVWCRYAAHLATVGLVWGVRRPTLWRTSRPVTQIGRSLTMLAMPGAFALAIRYGVSTEFIQALFWLAPLEVLAVAWIFLGERAPLSAWAAAAIGAAGSAAIFGHLYVVSPLALGLALAGSLSFSLYVVMTRSLRAEPSSTNLFYTGLAVFVILTPFMPRIWMWPSLTDVGVLGMVGAVGVFALYALERACEAGPVWIATIPLFLQAACLGAFDIAEHIEPARRAGMGVAMLAVVIGAFWLFADRVKPGIALARNK
jgi:drug/metabolite transporter (DMT)-like permease